MLTQDTTRELSFSSRRRKSQKKSNVSKRRREKM